MQIIFCIYLSIYARAILFQGKKCKRNNDKVAKDGAGVLAIGKQGTEPVPCLPINIVF